MKNRFPTAFRTTWRSRFVAIARQAEAAGRASAPQTYPRRPPEGSRRSAIRVQR